jgi:hypothetical protein
MTRRLMNLSAGRMLLAAALMLSSGVVCEAQSPARRVSFARGQSSATVSDSVPANHVNSYVLHIRKGQKIGARVTSANGKVDLDSDNIGGGQFEESGTTTFNVPVDQTGDYHIYVRNRGKAATRFTLTVTVR